MDFEWDFRDKLDDALIDFRNSGFSERDVDKLHFETWAYSEITYRSSLFKGYIMGLGLMDHYAELVEASSLYASRIVNRHNTKQLLEFYEASYEETGDLSEVIADVQFRTDLYSIHCKEYVDRWKMYYDLFSSNDFRSD